MSGPRAGGTAGPTSAGVGRPESALGLRAVLALGPGKEPARCAVAPVEPGPEPRACARLHVVPDDGFDLRFSKN